MQVLKFTLLALFSVSTTAASKECKCVGRYPKYTVRGVYGLLHTDSPIS